MINYSISWTSKSQAPADALAEGLAKHLQGALEEAISAYLRALRERPDRVLPCYNLAVALIDSGYGSSSVPLLKRAVLAQPGSQVFRGALIYALARSGRWEEVRPLLADAERSGLEAEVLARWRAAIEGQGAGGEGARAIEALRPSPADATFEFPDVPLPLAAGSEVHSRLQEPFAQALRDYQEGRLEGLIERLAPLLAEFPSWGEGHHVTGVAWMGRQVFDRAAAALERAAQLIPGRGELWDHLGVVYARLGRVDRLWWAFEQAQVLSPLRAESWSNAADAALRLGELEAAFQFALQAVRLDPDLPVASQCLLQAAARDRRARRSRTPEAPAATDRLDTAARLVTRLADTPARVMSLAPQLANVGLFAQAVQILERSLERSGSQPPALLGLLARNQRLICDWRHLSEREAALVELARGADAEVIAPLSAMSMSGFGLADLRRLERLTARQYEPWLDRRAECASGSRPDASDGRLRVGYLSDDFQEHATAYLMASLLERHDRGRFEVFAYSTGADDGGPMRRRLVNAFEHFVDIRDMDPCAAAGRIRADGIDILVDLKGYTRNNRLEILALRPSPVQVTWLGFPGGLGTAFVDYLIADRVVLPPEHAAYYDEAVAYLPDAYAPVDPSRQIADPPSRTDVGLPEQGFVFCCFGDPYKITPEVFDGWCRLLLDIPDSVLWLYAREGVEANVRREAEARGVSSERLVFGRKLPQPQHLARLALADLVLDTMPYNGHTTSSDALWVGVPVVACAGDTFASRVSASLLTAAGLPELITEDLEQYQALAARLAADAAAIADLRGKLAAARQHSAFFDVDGFARNLEALYSRMWERHRRGEPPASLGPVRAQA